MEVPQNLLYAKTHEWVRFTDGGKAQVGLTDYAQDALGDIVYFNLPSVGSVVGAGDAVGEVESVKAVSEVFAAVSGTICAVNDALADAPELINASPYGTWVFEVENAVDGEDLLTPEQYAALCDEEEGAHA
ncbi:MAG: glycine cleavage system protein GcvH [Oscillospiraceae bacterium]|nr:glycine cleavage system protein GcvH [Oscillospiraceae bacterium]